MTSRPDSPQPWNPAWIGGVVLIGLGVVFLLQNLGVPTLSGNWWALFILIPALGTFWTAYQAYQASGRLTRRIAGLISGGLAPMAIACIFLFDLDWGQVWPIFLILAGVSALMMSLAPAVESSNRHQP